MKKATILTAYGIFDFLNDVIGKTNDYNNIGRILNGFMNKLLGSTLYHFRRTVFMKRVYCLQTHNNR